MTNIVLLVKDRPRLTEQTLRTLHEETPRDQFNIVCVDDGSWPETSQILSRYSRRENCEIVTFLKSVSVVGFLRNVGAWTSERFFGRGDYLCFIDNDIAFLDGWLPKISEALDHVLVHPDGKEDGRQFGILGGYRHPHHGVNHRTGLMGMGLPTIHVEETDAVAGYMHFMRWQTWDLHGPYDQHAKGVCQSEDWAICQSIVQAKGHVGYVHPPVIANCGLTNSERNPAVGHESFVRYPGLIYE
jgi:glycosyltransferase involved in cell wall biosynthesis